uniref:Uncharacterized protein n=1 Tax=Caenorhabditis japonica TaxID=281687 RepID=A0A8R1EI18_CAEJA
MGLVISAENRYAKIRLTFGPIFVRPVRPFVRPSASSAVRPVRPRTDWLNSDGDPYGELVAEEWHGEFPEDNLHRRLQNIAINDRYEAYFEGEETDDEDSWG